MPKHVNNHLKILRQIARPHWFDIIELIKRSQGLSVKELSSKMDMSYMGVKKHCVSMHDLGLLETWRRPVEVGRPEKIYRLTDKVDCLFPHYGDDLSLMVLEGVIHLDPIAAEKIIFGFFRKQTEEFTKVVTGSSVQERAEQFAAARSKLGYYSWCLYAEEVGLWIEEYHNPMEAVFEKFPDLVKHEINMIERLLVRAYVERSVEEVKAMKRYRFDLSPR